MCSINQDNFNGKQTKCFVWEGWITVQCNPERMILQRRLYRIHSVVFVTFIVPCIHFTCYIHCSLHLFYMLHSLFLVAVKLFLSLSNRLVYETFKKYFGDIKPNFNYKSANFRSFRSSLKPYPLLVILEHFIVFN